MPQAYAAFVDVIAKVFLGLGILAGAVCVMDWAIRTRKIPPFSAVARFFRNRVDPLLRPIETAIVRRGGMPSAAPLWTLLAIVVTGIVTLQLLKFVGGLLMQLSAAAADPRQFPLLPICWAPQRLLVPAPLARI